MLIFKKIINGAIIVVDVHPACANPPPISLIKTQNMTIRANKFDIPINNT